MDIRNVAFVVLVFIGAIGALAGAFSILVIEMKITEKRRQGVHAPHLIEITGWWTLARIFGKERNPVLFAPENSLWLKLARYGFLMFFAAFVLLAILELST